MYYDNPFGEVKKKISKPNLSINILKGIPKAIVIIQTDILVH